MKLKVKRFNWLAGRPVVILNEETAKKLNVHVDERVEINSSRKIYAVVDIFENLVKNGEIGFSHEVSNVTNTKHNSKVEVNSAQISLSGKLIKKKISGEQLTKDELNTIISDVVHNNLTEAEIAYFAAAEKMKGMSEKEIIFLTEAMVKNGNKLKFNKKIIADKHSIGGIAGNRTTPLVVSICAAAGLILPKTSSRAITSAAGTADVIETIAKVEFSTKDLKKIVEKTNGCLAWGGSLNLAPSDDKIIQVERLLNLDVEPQLLASIMSKKIAAGSNRILIDIPYGKSAKMKTKNEAQKLANHFKKISKHFNLKLKVVLTNGSQPIGNGIGPVLEMLDVISVLRQDKERPKDLEEKSLYLSAELMKLCGIKNPKQKAKEILESGEAYRKFQEIVNAQNKKKDFTKRLNKLKPAKYKKDIVATKTSKIKEIDNKKINSLCRIIGTPETPTAGVYLHKHLGKITKGEKILTIYSESQRKLKDAIKYYNEFKPVVIG